MKKAVYFLLALMVLMVLPFIGLAQTNSTHNTSLWGDLSSILIALAICVVIFLVLRKLVLWYWKVETLISNQQQQIKELQSISKLIEENNSLLQIQIELVIGRSTEV